MKQMFFSNSLAFCMIQWKVYQKGTLFYNHSRISKTRKCNITPGLLCSIVRVHVASAVPAVFFILFLAHGPGCGTGATCCCCCSVAELCLTLCDPMDYTVFGVLQARILEWVAFTFSRESPQPRDRTLHCRRILYQLSHKGSSRRKEIININKLINIMSEIPKAI